MIQDLTSRLIVNENKISIHRNLVWALKIRAKSNFENRRLAYCLMVRLTLCVFLLTRYETRVPVFDHDVKI